MRRKTSPTIERLRQSLWDDLHVASDTIRQGQVLKAMILYRRILKRDVLALFYTVPDDEANDEVNVQYPLSEIAFLLSHYYMHLRDWKAWSRLYNALTNHPAYARATPDRRIWIESVEQNTRIFHNGDLDNIITALKPQLESAQIHNLTRGLIHRILTIAYRLKRDEAQAFYHVNEALATATFDEEPFYYISYLEARAVIYYYLNQGRQHYYEQAITLLNEVEGMARAVSDGYDFTHNGYNVGWCYAEIEDYENARINFENGLRDAETGEEIFTIARLKYGLGYVEFATGNYDAALKNLQEALEHFVSISYLMTGVTLYIMAKCFTEIGAYDTALDRLDSAIDNLSRVVNPVQRHHVYRQYSVVWFKNRNWYQALLYAIRMYYLRIRYKMKLWPY